MRKTLAITGITALLALTLTACGTQDVNTDPLPDVDGNAAGATDTMRNSNGTAGTGTTGGAATGSTAANSDASWNSAAANGGAGLGSVTGAAYGSARYGADRSGRAAKDAPDTTPDTADRSAADRRYERMLENGRVHDRDGYLLDGENTSWRTW